MDTKKINPKEKRDFMIFKWHIVIFLLGVALFWIIWYFEFEQGDFITDKKKFPWPVWPMLIWIMALRIHYVAVFKRKNNSTHH